MVIEKFIFINYGLLIILISMSLYTDWKTNKIKNVIVYPFMVVGLILNLVVGGWIGGLQSFYGIGIPIVLLLIFYIVGAMGAGDLKLFAAIGALMGKDFVLKTMVVSFISGGFIALGLMIIRKNGRQRLKYLINYICMTIISGKINGYTQIKKDRDGKFPFAVAIFTGVMIMIFLKPL
ncbi:A24 family peptidase [Alkaliphilus hydrothermalis]|uniref:Prepilin peptidase CpaA n=1 Tax=Alkaliphilus hydrothermalis TaxID=1482730 RepID=A0ABS2NS98_9FIRM|nr:A24 family peptidase [Alkaliphilus hydrothermalis]MBM7615828.1 prepilin peptidase CpaA [Alkaliphilus hydrothermalis]